MLHINKIANDASIYLCTSSNKKFPYVTYLAFENTKFIHKYSGLTKGKVTKQKKEIFFMQLSNYLKTSEIESFGQNDVLKTYLETKSWYLWKDKYCKLCDKLDCTKDSISCFKCQRSAFVIGALDETETADIYKMYKLEEETIYSCYRRIEKHTDLDKVVEKALSRWPDAFFSEDNIN